MSRPTLAAVNQLVCYSPNWLDHNTILQQYCFLDNFLVTKNQSRCTKTLKFLNRDWILEFLTITGRKIKMFCNAITHYRSLLISMSLPIFYVTLTGVPSHELAIFRSSRSTPVAHSFQLYLTSSQFLSLTLRPLSFSS